MSGVQMRVRVPVATLWLSPDRPREVDGPALADEPDIAAWLAALDSHRDDSPSGNGRIGLQGRVQSQVLAGEPVTVVGTDPDHQGWVAVVCPWQPSSQDPRGYPGWLRRAHLAANGTDVIGAGDGTEHSAAAQGDESEAPRHRPHLDGGSSRGMAERSDLALARGNVGLPYLWGGLSPSGLDCSGLVHFVHRRLGRRIPRDAHDQQAATIPIDPADARPGDLYFFARSGAPAHHVGIVTDAYRMIHASESRAIVEEPLDERRAATLSGAGRIPD
jgi:cell wall-associated NlpC family hydrolase